MPQDRRWIAACLVAVAFVAVACGGSSATPTPAATAADVPVASGAAASPVHGDPVLAGQFPRQIAGQELDVQSQTGRDLVALGDPQDPATQAALEALQTYVAGKGRSLDQLGYMYASIEGDSGDSATLHAARLPGVNGRDLETGMIPLLTEGFTDIQKSPVDIAGKATTRVSDGAFDPQVGAMYLYPKGDILWAVEGVEPLLTLVFEALP